ncbi:hypothetical protein LPJ61_001384 [Coemansia biformis]|uniref:Uncharacterized protein n=1 Tax=Coemansia biformis TaxID=1286918 RepID=A0A9W7YH04_9FUNG|nr:hypothetical protein LPJ61_001384 [Coemansia biformis]
MQTRFVVSVCVPAVLFAACVAGSASASSLEPIHFGGDVNPNEILLKYLSDVSVATVGATSSRTTSSHTTSTHTSSTHKSAAPAAGPGQAAMCIAILASVLTLGV